MNEILNTKPKSIFSFKDENLTYEQILQAISNKNTNRFLQGVVATCKANPTNVIVVVYRAFADSVIMVFGTKPTAVIVNGTDLKKNFNQSVEKDYFYIFVHSK